MSTRILPSICAVVLFLGGLSAPVHESSCAMQDDDDARRRIRQRERRWRLNLALYQEAREKMEALIAAQDLFAAYAFLPRATAKAHAAFELGMPIVWRDYLDVLGIERLAAAETTIERGDVAEGLLEIQRIALLRNLPVGTTATLRMAEARRDPAVRDALREADAEALYQQADELMRRGLEAAAESADLEAMEDALVLDNGGLPPPDVVEPYMVEPIAEPPPPEERTAARALSDDDLVALFGTLDQVIELYPDTRAAFKATWTLEVLREDPLLTQRVARHENEQAAGLLLASALNFRANERLPEAIALLEQLLRDHPASKAAAKAATLLEEIRGQK